MHGTGVPLVTPFDAAGDVDETALADLVGWFEPRGVDFLVPCGSTSEAPLLSPDERRHVVELVVEAAEIPVLAGTGFAGLSQTITATRRAADAGADGALVVTPHYYSHDQGTLVRYYRDLVDAVDLPIYLYSVPKFTGTTLSPRSVETLADVDGVTGIKDSSGSLEALQRTRSLAPDLDVFVGRGSLYAAGLAAGADGGVLALANVAPERASEVRTRYGDGATREAIEHNRELAELNHALTSEYGVPGVKAAMRLRGAPAGVVRRPFQPVSDEAGAELEELLEDAQLL